MLRISILTAVVAISCATGRGRPTPVENEIRESLRLEQEMVTIAGGPFRRGSTSEERERAYADYERTRGKDTARLRGWFRHEPDAGESVLGTFVIDLHPVTQAAFAEYLRATSAKAPSISRSDWKSQGFIHDYDREVRRFLWNSKVPPQGRANHPVVLVDWAEARAYCKWRGTLVGEERDLPSADEFEKASRGHDGAAYPWGPDFDASKLNSAVSGPRDTTPVKAFPQGASASGVLGTAGNVFQWTRTPWPHGQGRMTVKGSAWDDWGGLGRAAAAHGRLATARHVIVGFRCAGLRASVRP